MGFDAAATTSQRRPASPALQVRPITWPEAMPIVERVEDAAPQSLRDIPGAERPARWPAWLAAQRRALTSRVAQGDVDSVVNLLLFGTSFTQQPRITTTLLADLNRRWSAGDRSAQEALAGHYQRRAADLIAAAGKPDAPPRMQDVRRVLSQHGHDLATTAGRRTATDFLFANLARVREEAAHLGAELQAARNSADPTATFAERSRIFRNRGLSADSSVLTQFAVDRAVCALRDSPGFGPLTVKRVAVVGPGLDFADKQEGLDFYDPQSLQPFTLADSLLHCGLADRGALQIATLDVSARVNGHLRAAVQRAASQGAPYRLVLPWNTENVWRADAEAYWKRAGGSIGRERTVAAPRAHPAVRARGLDVRPEIVRRVRPIEASIVSDRLRLPDDQRFDLVVATNVLVYYDTFEQSLALASIAAMLRPGGVLVTNDAVLEIPEIPMRSAGDLAVPFSTRPGDGERMVWYVKAK